MVLIQMKENGGTHHSGNNGEKWLDPRYMANVSKQVLFKIQMSGEGGVWGDFDSQVLVLNNWKDRIPIS